MNTQVNVRKVKEEKKALYTFGVLFDALNSKIHTPEKKITRKIIGPFSIYRHFGPHNRPVFNVS